MAGPNIHTCFWFDGQAEEAAKFYTSIFPNSKVELTTFYLEAGKECHGQEPGSVQLVLFELNGKPFSALNGGPIYANQFNPGTSYVVPCKDQAEIDYYWEKLGEGVDDSDFVCGWLKDKFGVSWQVVPEEMVEIFASEDKKRAGAAMTAMMQMKKLEIEPLRAAFGKAK